MGGPLSSEMVDAFVTDGFVRIDGAFPRGLADEARAYLWRDCGCDPADPATWTRAVIRLGMYTQEPFRAAANTPLLHGAFDQLVGAARWLPCGAVGTIPVRFPSAEDPGDTGWHLDASFGWEDPDFLNWRVNIRSRGRALVMLMLFSDVGPEDAPTVLATGSHADLARRLAPAGEAGMTLGELRSAGAFDVGGRRITLATGDAGTVFLCHPFLVHSAQRHRGTRPRFLAQPPLLPRDPEGYSVDGESPVARAIRNALDER